MIWMHIEWHRWVQFSKNLMPRLPVRKVSRIPLIGKISSRSIIVTFQQVVLPPNNTYWKNIAINSAPLTSRLKEYLITRIEQSHSQPTIGKILNSFIRLGLEDLEEFGKCMISYQKRISRWNKYPKKSNIYLIVRVIEKNSVECIMNEKMILSNLSSNFLINISQAFQDDKNLYLIMDYLRGADLRYHICYKEYFT